MKCASNGKELRLRYGNGSVSEKDLKFQRCTSKDDVCMYINIYTYMYAYVHTYLQLRLCMFACSNVSCLFSVGSFGARLLIYLFLFVEVFIHSFIQRCFDCFKST